MRWGLGVPRDVRHPHSPIEIEYSFYGQSNFSAYKLRVTGGGFDVTGHADATCPLAGGDIEGLEVSWENTTCTAVPKGGVLCQDRVRETAWSM